MTKDHLPQDNASDAAAQPEATQPTVTYTFQLVNSRQHEVAVYLEPWAEEYAMPPGATFTVTARGPKPEDLPRAQYLQVEVGDDSITVYGWTGSVVWIGHA